MTEVGIVVVTYCSRDVIGTCLNACTTLGAPVVVVDNASSDGTADEVRHRWPGVTLIANTRNLGFAAACNQGIASLDTETVLLLNPDAEPLTSLTPLIAAVRQPGSAIAGGRLIDLAGHDQRGFAIRRLPTAPALILEILGINRLWPGNPVNQRYRCLDQDPSQPGPAEQPAGAFLLIRRAVWEQLGGLDETFHPLWFEDVDFCRRVKDAGYHGWYVPAVIARHQGAHSANRLDNGERPLFWYSSLIQYAVKHFPPGPRAGVGIALLLATFIRLGKSLLWDRSFATVRTYRQIGRMAWRMLLRASSPQAKDSMHRPGKSDERSVI